LSSNHDLEPTTKAKPTQPTVVARYRCNIPWSSSKFRRVGGTDLPRMPSDGWPSYFCAVAYHLPPTTVLLGRRRSSRRLPHVCFHGSWDLERQ